MKMFKKLMAVALTAVMAVSMLTGCALTDAVRDKAVEKAQRTSCPVMALRLRSLPLMPRSTPMWSRLLRKS